MVRVTLWTAPTEHHLMSLRAKRAAGFGVEGGRDGRAGGVWVFDPPADGIEGAPGTEPESYGAATPLAGVVDPETHVSFPDLNAHGGEATQTNLVMPEPCEFIRKDLPACSVIRPTLDENAGAVAAVKALTADQLFKGQSPRFFSTLMQLARAADAAHRHV